MFTVTVLYCRFLFGYPNGTQSHVCSILTTCSVWCNFLKFTTRTISGGLHKSPSSLSRNSLSSWLQASAATFMRSALFWDIMQRRVVILYRRFGTTCPILKGKKSINQEDFLTFEGGTGCSETSVKVYHSALYNIPEELRFQPPDFFIFFIFLKISRYFATKFTWLGENVYVNVWT
jgi:hypothetical protein